MIHIYPTHEFQVTHAYVCDSCSDVTCLTASHSCMYVRCMTPPMFLITYTYNDIQTYIQTTRHALHVEASQHDLLQRTDWSHPSVPYLAFQSRKVFSYCLSPLDNPSCSHHPPCPLPLVGECLLAPQKIQRPLHPLPGPQTPFPSLSFGNMPLRC